MPGGDLRAVLPTEREHDDQVLVTGCAVNCIRQLFLMAGTFVKAPAQA
jgi:hypothetical protein